MKVTKQELKDIGVDADYLGLETESIIECCVKLYKKLRVNRKLRVLEYNQCEEAICVLRKLLSDDRSRGLFSRFKKSVATEVSVRELVKLKKRRKELYNTCRQLKKRERAMWFIISNASAFLKSLTNSVHEV